MREVIARRRYRIHFAFTWPDPAADYHAIADCLGAMMMRISRRRNRMERTHAMLECSSAPVAFSARRRQHRHFAFHIISTLNILLRGSADTADATILFCILAILTVHLLIIFPGAPQVIEQMHKINIRLLEVHSPLTRAKFTKITNGVRCYRSPHCHLRKY